MNNIKVFLAHFGIVFIRIDPEVVAHSPKKIIVLFFPELNINIAIRVNKHAPAVQMQLVFGVFTNELPSTLVLRIVNRDVAFFTRPHRKPTLSLSRKVESLT